VTPAYFKKVDVEMAEPAPAAGVYETGADLAYLQLGPENRDAALWVGGVKPLAGGWLATPIAHTLPG
jgi:hypothetical protein